MEDPFLLDQNRVESHLTLMRQQLQRWRQLRDADTSGEHEDREDIEEEFQCLSGELSQGVKSIGWDLDDLQETLQMMLDAKAPQMTPASVRESRAAFVAKSRCFLDEVAREVAMATAANKKAPQVAAEKGSKADKYDWESGRATGYDQDHDKTRPLLTWQKDVDQVSFPSVVLNSLTDLRMRRFQNRDWTGFIYRYRYLLAMLAAVCLVVFFTIVALAAKHTAGSARLAAAAASTTAMPTTAAACKHLWCIGGR